MILQALNQFYERLQADPDADIAPFGYSRQKITFCVVINDDGSLHEIVSELDESDGRARPRSIVVPGGAKPSGAGINPCFLWDNTGYLLGFKPDDENPERTRETFEAFRQKHLAIAAEIDDPELSAVCSFLEKWDPEMAAGHPTLQAVTTGFGVFRLRAKAQYVHERPAIRSWWEEQLQSVAGTASTRGQCLLTGRVESLARLHEPKIKGVNGAQSSGAALVSFNDKAYESHGRSQGFNAPVSEAAAFQYCTALNYLLHPDHRHRIQLPDTTVVYWTESPGPFEELFGFVADPTKIAAEDEAQKDRIRETLKAIASGRSAEDLSLGEGETRFFVLGLSPNAARLSVRFWYVCTLNELIANIRQHFIDLSVARSSRDTEYPALWQLLRETVRESKDIPPLLSGAVLRCILIGSAYPQMFFSAVIRRIRADRQINAIRASILKACLNRNLRCGISSLSKELPVSLDPERPEAAYQLGRLFAELEKAQEDALPGINATIKDRYFSAASATPGSVFPRIIRGSQHHLAKLEMRAKVYREKRIQEVFGRIDDFPSHLNLAQQGLFALGYYHQRQAIYTKRQEAESAVPSVTE